MSFPDICHDVFMNVGYFLFDLHWIDAIIVISLFVGVLLCIPRIIRIGNHDEK